jgi:hypothetical protein
MKITPITNYEGICFKCLNKKDSVHTYHLHERGYGSTFDGTYSILQLCDDCKPKDLELWLNEQPKYDEYCEEYEYEDYIHEFVNALPVQGRELFDNTCANGWTSYHIEPQDYIDMQLGILPDEKYKEYGFYSPSEIKLYKERFPTCEYPAHRIYNDNSVGCWCPFGAYGDKGQISGLNICDECHNCKNYKPRENPIKDIKDQDWLDYEIYIKSKIYKEKLDRKFNNI